MNKITAALLGLLLTASLANAGHTEPDGDAFPLLVEHAICGTGGTTSGDLVNLIGVAGSCDTSNGNYTFNAGGTPAACSGCTSQVIIDEVDMPLTPARDVGPVWTPPAANVTALHTYYDTVGGTPVYCIHLQPHTIGCFNIGGTTAPPIGPIYIANATIPQQNVPATSMDVRIEYRFINGSTAFCCNILGSAEAWYPVDPFSPADIQWWAANGDQTSLDIFLEPRLDGTATGTPVQISIPYLGQVIGTEMKSSPINPFPL